MLYCYITDSIDGEGTILQYFVENFIMVPLIFLQLALKMLLENNWLKANSLVS